MRGMVGALVLVLAAPAFAESPADLEAKQHFIAGQKSFDAARWADALVEFQKSYELSKYPALLYKVALCQDQLGQFQDALASYRRYLAEDPQTERRAAVEELIDRIEKILAPSPRPEPPPKLAGDEPKPKLAAAEPHRTPIYKKWWLWTIVGVAVVGGVAVGLGVGLTQGGISRPADWNPSFVIGPAQALVSF